MSNATTDQAVIDVLQGFVDDLGKLSMGIAPILAARDRPENAELFMDRIEDLLAAIGQIQGEPAAEQLSELHAAMTVFDELLRRTLTKFATQMRRHGLGYCATDLDHVRRDFFDRYRSCVSSVSCAMFNAQAAERWRSKQGPAQPSTPDGRPVLLRPDGPTWEEGQSSNQIG